MTTEYRYVGPDEIRNAVLGDPSGVSIRVADDLRRWAAEQSDWEGDVALEVLAVVCPLELTRAFTFRRCDTCGERNLVKDDWFECDLCGGELAGEWNFG